VPDLDGFFEGLSSDLSCRLFILCGLELQIESKQEKVGGGGGSAASLRRKTRCESRSHVTIVLHRR